MPIRPDDEVRRNRTRSYSDGCAASRALDLIGERWALLVVRELVLGPKRFTDLRSGLPTISPNVLAQRIDELEEAAIVRRRRLPPPSSTWVYELTDWGAELGPVIMSLGRWAARSPSKPNGPMSIASLILSFRTMFDSSAAGDLKARIELQLRDETFHAEISEGRFNIERGAASAPNATIVTDPDTLATVVYAGRPLTEAMRAGDVKIDGDKSTIKRFLTLFPLPERAAAPAVHY